MSNVSENMMKLLDSCIKEMDEKHEKEITEIRKEERENFVLFLINYTNKLIDEYERDCKKRDDETWKKLELRDVR